MPLFLRERQEVTASTPEVTEETPAEPSAVSEAAEEPVPVPEAVPVPAEVAEPMPETVPEAVPEMEEKPVAENTPAMDITEVTESQVPYYPEEAEMTEQAAEEMTPPPEAENIPPAEPSKEDALPRQARAKRRSVANDDPSALDRAARQPVVRDVLELFGGEVVDVHVKMQDGE